MNADGWYDAAWQAQRARRFDVALAAYAQALALGLDRPEDAHLGRAAIYAEHLGRSDLARQELAAALAKAPDCAAAHLNLGQLHERAGDRDAARAAYAQALACAPDLALARARLAGVSAADDVTVRALRQALDAASHPEERADLGFALARQLDALGRWDEAFDAASDAQRAAAAGRAAHDPIALEQRIDAILAAPTPALPADGSRPPIFVCGAFRSGTTLVERILAAHPRVQAGGELDWPPLLAHHHARDPAAIRDAYGRALQARFPHADRMTDKRPDNLLHVGLIQQLWPGAPVVVLQRDRRDTALSTFFTHLGPVAPWAADWGHLQHALAQFERLAQAWQQRWPRAVHTLRYETLVQDPEVEVAKLLRFCGLDWDARCLQPATGEVATPSTWQVREPIHARSVGRWRAYASRFTSAAGGSPRPGG